MLNRRTGVRPIYSMGEGWFDSSIGLKVNEESGLVSWNSHQGIKLC
jgi:hypothetical protein